MTVHTFADSFWDADWTGTSGSEALSKRMRIGRNTCKDLLDFFRERASIEKDYGSKLQKLARSMEKKAHNTDESQTMDDSIAKLIEEAENIAKVHTGSAQRYSDRVEKLHKFQDAQKEEKKKLEENMKKCQSHKISQYNKTQSLQKQYQNKCRERDQVRTQYEAACQSVTVQTKDKEKMKSKLDKAETSMEQADSAYRASVDNLEQVRLTWEKDMTETCNRFQELEEERIEILRNEIWIHCNIMSEVCVDVDEHCEATREQLEKCSVDQDIADFICSNKTGSNRPCKIEYENYHSGVTPSKRSPKTGRLITEAPCKPTRSPAVPPRVFEPGSNVVQPKRDVIMDGDYATITDDTSSAPLPPRK